MIQNGASGLSRKTELLGEASRRGLAVLPHWTVPEIRSILQEDNEKMKGESTIPKGLSSMKLEELVKMAETLDVMMPRKGQGDNSCDSSETRRRTSPST